MSISARLFTRSASLQQIQGIGPARNFQEKQRLVRPSFVFSQDPHLKWNWAIQTKLYSRDESHFSDKYIQKTMSQLYVSHVLILSFALQFQVSVILGNFR